MLLNEVSIRDGDLLPRRTRLRYPHNINGCCCCKSSCYRCRCSCECCCCRCGRSPGSCNLSAPKFYNSPAAAVLADAQHCYSEFLAAAAAPVAADITADPAWLHRLPQCRLVCCICCCCTMTSTFEVVSSWLERGVPAATVTDAGAGAAASTPLASAAAAAAAAAGADCFATSAHRNSNTPLQLARSCCAC